VGCSPDTLVGGVERKVLNRLAHMQLAQQCVALSSVMVALLSSPLADRSLSFKVPPSTVVAPLFWRRGCRATAALLGYVFLLQELQQLEKI
jgi:hypothetical protein